MPEKEEMSEDRFQVLCYEQVDRLNRVMNSIVPIHGRGNFPTLNIRLKDFIKVVKNQLKSSGVRVRDVRVNGGVASYVLGLDTVQSYNDYDLIFSVQLKDQSDLQKIKDLVLSSLLDFFPKSIIKDRMSLTNLNEAYVHKMVKIFNDTDKWSLISLSNARSKNIELKFADSMRRQFEFSVDSFQIILDSLLLFYDVSKDPIQEHFYPTINAESVYANFDLALHHLNEKIIATRNPEEIRGGGLLKYCKLLVRGYQPAIDTDILQLQKYMCSRFFIDFSNINDQKTKLDNYLADHFLDDEELRYHYLRILYTVVNESTICLMGHERRQTLELIETMAHNVLFEQKYQLSRKQSQQPLVIFDQKKSKLIVDQVFYGPFSYSFPGIDQPHQYYTVYSYDYKNNNFQSNNINIDINNISSGLFSPVMCPYCDSHQECR